MSQRDNYPNTMPINDHNTYPQLTDYILCIWEKEEKNVF